MTLIEIEIAIKELFALWIEKKNVKKQLQHKVQYSGPLFGKEEYDLMLDAIFLDWWSRGKYTKIAQEKLAQISNRKYGLLLNSGSSANFVLMKAARELFFEDGDKIVTLSCGFPTTVNPIIESRLIPLFVDIKLDNLGLDPNLLEQVLKEDPKVKGVFVAHNLGFPNEVNEILDVAKKYGAQVFFDCCDSYGTKYENLPIQQFGKAVTFSFYAAHHITSGEGGGVVTDDVDFHKTMRGFRDWGRYCSSPHCCIRATDREAFCPTDRLTEHCGLPDDYFVGYQFEWLGSNLKLLDLQSAILLAQINKMSEFSTVRRRNYEILYRCLSKSRFGFRLWKITEDISPFSFPIILPEDAPFNRKQFVDFLTEKGIETRLLFGGNLMKHPAYTNKKYLWQSYEKNHVNADIIMNRFVMLGVAPLNTVDKMNRIVDVLEEFLGQW